MSPPPALYLRAGKFGLSRPAVLVTAWQIGARLEEPGQSGFRLIAGPDEWKRMTISPLITLAVLPTRNGVVIDLGPYSLSLLTLEFDKTANSQWHRDVTSSGQVIVATAELAAYWAHRRRGTQPSFTDLFPLGSRAATARVLVPRHRGAAG